jgi:hypothetical protein
MEDMKSIDERFDELFKELYGDDEVKTYETATVDSVDSFRSNPQAMKHWRERIEEKFNELFNEVYGDDDNWPDLYRIRFEEFKQRRRR